MRTYFTGGLSIHQRPYSCEEIEEILKTHAQLQLPLSLTVESQTVSWNSLTGGATVLTKHKEQAHAQNG
jgi:hypothetical protein